MRVLDFTRVISGPYCTMMLADMGADVVKVEEPPHGDETRGIIYSGRSKCDQDYFYASNRSKRSIALDLKVPADRATAEALAKRADVVVENFAPGVAERLGIGWNKLCESNPRLIYCAISGFGQTGPYRSRPALDPVIQALSGIMSVTGFEDQPPLNVGAPIADVVAGMFSAYAIVCAWHHCVRTGVGRYIDVSMLDSMIAVLGPRMGQVLQAGTDPGRHGNGNPVRVPTNTYRTRDDRFLMVCVLNDRHWGPFCAAMGRPEWAARLDLATMRGRVERRQELDAMIAADFLTREAAEWELRFDDHHIPYGVVNNYLEAVEDPQVRHRQMIWQVSHPISGALRLVGVPWKIEGCEVTVAPPPLLNQHASQVVEDWLGSG